SRCERQGDAPGLRRREHPRAPAHHDRRPLRAHTARPDGRRAGSRPQGSPRARALLRTRRLHPGRGGAGARGSRMKLLRLGTSGFGGLRGYFRFDPTRVTIIVDANERGKTTMLAAVSAALYGLVGDRRSHRLLTPHERWRPWNGNSYDVEIEVECDGNRYTVSRNFD